jgi:hypothetical protein
MAPPTYTSKKSALPEIRARQRLPADEFEAFFEETIDEVWEEIVDGEDATDEQSNQIAVVIFRNFVRKHYRECEDGLGLHEEGKPILQIIATYQSQSQEFINFGDFRFNNATVEEMKEFAMEEFDAEFKDIIKISCEYRWHPDTEGGRVATPADRHADAVFPAWYRAENGKCWWHVNVCEQCGVEFVDATNPPRCGHCVAGTTPAQ